jgi:hypothetical protein
MSAWTNAVSPLDALGSFDNEFTDDYGFGQDAHGYNIYKTNVLAGNGAAGSSVAGAGMAGPAVAGPTVAGPAVADAGLAVAGKAVEYGVPNELVCNVDEAMDTLTGVDLSFRQKKVCAAFVKVGVDANGVQQKSLDAMDVGALAEVVREHWPKEDIVERFITDCFTGKVGDPTKEKMIIFTVCMHVLNHVGIIEMTNMMATTTPMLLPWMNIKVMKKEAWWAFLRACLPEDGINRKKDALHLFGTFDAIYELLASMGYKANGDGLDANGDKFKRPRQSKETLNKKVNRKESVVNGLKFMYQQDVFDKTSKRLLPTGRSGAAVVAKAAESQVRTGEKRTVKTMLEMAVSGTDNGGPAKKSRGPNDESGMRKGEDPRDGNLYPLKSFLEEYGDPFQDSLK